MQHARANHQVERAAKLPDALDRELMQFEIFQIVLALKIARVAKARVAHVDRRDSGVGLPERVPRGLRSATAGDRVLRTELISTYFIASARTCISPASAERGELLRLDQPVLRLAQVVERSGEFARARLNLVEQAHVLDRECDP